MINGVLENLNISWEERLGYGMRIISGGSIEEIIFQHERKDEHTLVSTLVKNSHPYHMDTYKTDDSGMLVETTSQLIGNPPHWCYSYRIIDGNLQISKKQNSKEDSVYAMVATEKDENGRITRAEYRELDTNNLIATLYFERDKNGRLKAEILEENAERQVTHVDAAGRYLKMEFFNNGHLSRTFEYLH